MDKWGWLRTSVAVALLVACSQHGTIGAVLGQQPSGRVFIREAPAGLAAHEAGLREGDEILLIDGMDVRGMDTERIHRVLSGEVNEEVKLTVVRGDQVLRVTLKRTRARRMRKAEFSGERTQ